MAKEITYYGQLRPTGVDNSTARRFEALAGIAGQVKDAAFKYGAEKAQREGEREGLTAGQAAAVEGQPLEKREGLLSAFSIKDNAYNDALESAYLSQVSVDAKNEIANVVAQAPNDTQAFDALAAKARAGILTGVDQRYADVIGGTLDNAINTARTNVFAKEVDKNRSLAKSARVDAVDLNIREASGFARGGDTIQAANSVIEAITNIDSLVSTGDLDFAVGEKQKRAITIEVEGQSFLHDLEQKAEAEGFEAAYEALAELERPSEFTPDEWERFTANASSTLSMAEKVEKAAQATELADAEREIGRQVSDLEIAAKNDLLPKEQIVEQANDLFNQDKISYQQRTSIIDAAISRTQTEINEAQSVATVSSSLAGDPSAIPTQKDVDVYYEKSQVAFDTSPAKTAMQAQFIGSTRLVPTRVKREVESALMSQDIERMAAAVDLIDRVDEIPGMFGQLVTANQRALAATATSLSEVLPGEQAVIQAMKLTDPRNTDRIEAARETIKDEKFSEKYASWTEDALGDMPAVNGARAVRQYKELFETYFVNGMSESDARTQTERAMVANWGESEDFGFMQYRPEDFYAVNGETSYIKDQLVKDVRSQFAFPDPIAADDMFLVSDDNTARTAASGKPEYVVMVRTAAGELVTLQDRDTGIVYWTPDQDTEISRQRAEAKTAYEKAREANRPLSPDELALISRFGPTPGFAISDNSNEEQDRPDMFRVDGSRKSARGYLGPVENVVQGGTMTEVSIDVPVNGVEMQIPTMVPTLTRKEIDTLANMQLEGNAKNIPQSIKRKAIAHAKKRIAEGKSVFYQDGE